MLQINGLVKAYGKYRAVNELSMSIQKGDIFGFVGPNGAGKTTTMRIIAGLLSADHGEVTLDGINALKKNMLLKEKIGYMPDFFGVYDNLKAIEYLEFYASIYGVLGKEATKLCLELLDIVNLKDKENAYVDTLSRGMKQRLCLARSLVHNPQLLILDEPASGLDPRARYEMKEILRNLRDMGKTILISSHILPELAELCTRIGIIDKGKLVVSGTMDEIQGSIHSSSPLIIRVLEDTAQALILLKEDPLVEKVYESAGQIKVSYAGDDQDIHLLLYKLLQSNIRVYSYYRESGNLESLFMTITDKGMKEGETV